MRRQGFGFLGNSLPGVAIPGSRLAAAATLVFGLAFSSLFAGCAPREDPPDGSVPNLLFVLYDDLDSVGDLEPFGADPLQVQTPFANQLAAAGRRFDHFYVNAPVCSPTRVALLSGHYPTRFGFTFASEETSRRGLTTTVDTLPRRLSRRGYLTGAFGKWHIGSSQDGLLPQSLGFDRAAINCTFTNLGRSPVKSVPGSDGTPSGYSSYNNALFCDRPGDLLADSGRSFATTYTVDKALELIADALDAPAGEAPGPKARPFYAQLWLHAPHTPLTCPPDAPDCPDCDPSSNCDPAQKRRIHHAMISHAESQLMRLHADLSARGEWKNTVILLASDNGGVGGWHEASAALRGAKGSLFERGVRTPLLIAGPGIEAGVVDDVVSGHDLLPTLTELLGLEPLAPEAAADGLDPASAGLSFADTLRPHLSTQDDAAEDDSPREVSREGATLRAQRALFWELRPRANYDSHTPAGHWRQLAVQRRLEGRRYKLVKTDLYSGGSEPQLFDLDTDPGEKHDLGPDQPAIRRLLHDQWRAWRLENAALRPQIRPAPDGPPADGPLRFDGHRHFTVIDHPALTIGHLDFSVAFELTLGGPEQSPRTEPVRRDDAPDGGDDQAKWLVGRPGSWALRLEPRPSGKSHLVFTFEGHRPQRLEHPTPILPGETFRVVASITNRRGLSLFVDDRAIRARVRFGAVAESDEPIQIGRGPGDGEPFVGEIKDLTFFPIALDAEDLALRGLGQVHFEGQATPTLPLDDPALDGPAPDGPTPDGPAPLAIQAKVPVRALDAPTPQPFELIVECLRDGRSDWHPDAKATEERLAEAEELTHTVRHLCPAGSDALRLVLNDAKTARTLIMGPVSVGRLGTAMLSHGFEPGDPPTPWRRHIKDLDLARTGRFALEVPAGSKTPDWIVPTDGTEGLDITVWARSADESRAFLHLALTCLDTQGQAVETPTGNRPRNREAITSPAKVDGIWRRFRVLYSCPRESKVQSVGLSFHAEGESSLVIDDISVVVP